MQRTLAAPAHAGESQKNPVMVEAGKKAAIARATGRYTFDQHLEAKPDQVKDLARALQEFILKLDPAIEEAPKKMYVAYRTSQNIACVEVRKHKILVFMKLDAKKVKGPPGIARDVTDLGHYGTGNLEVAIGSAADPEAAKPYIVQAYQAVGA